MFSLVNKTAVITGGGSGIGKAIAVTFAARGAAVHVLELTTEAGADTAATIKAAGGSVTVHACNVANKDEVNKVFASIGAIDILVNNAGVANSISPARVHTPFVDGFIAKNYPGKEAEMFEKLSASQPIGRMAQPNEVAALALYLASDEASFITGCDYPIDGGFIKLNN